MTIRAEGLRKQEQQEQEQERTRRRSAPRTAAAAAHRRRPTAAALFLLLPRLLLLLFLLPATTAAAAEGTKPARRKVEPREGPTRRSLEARGMISRAASAADLAEGGREYRHEAALSRRRRALDGPVLAYVTPWNRDGYAAAVRFRGRLTHVSPVWYQLRTDGEGALVLTGGHEFNATWLQELRAPLAPASEGGGVDGGSDGGGDGDSSSGGEQDGAQACGSGEAGGGGDGEQKQTCSAGEAAAAAKGDSAPVRVLPRVVVELAPRELGLLLGRPAPAIERLVQEAERRGYDGFVLDAWQSWAAMGGFRDAAFSAAAYGFTRELATSLRAAGGRELFVAVPPALPAAPGRPAADAAAMRALGDVVAGWSVMTYDWLATLPGANGPLLWQRANLERLLAPPDDDDAAEGGGKSGAGTRALAPASVLLGVNFYGYEFSSGGGGSGGSGQWAAEPVKAERFLSVLARLQPEVRWDAASAENYIKFKEAGKRRQLWFPTPAALSERVALARELGAGLSIWEIGQGMDALFDVL